MIKWLTSLECLMVFLTIKDFDEMAEELYRVSGDGNRCSDCIAIDRCIRLYYKRSEIRPVLVSYPRVIGDMFTSPQLTVLESKALTLKRRRLAVTRFLRENANVQKSDFEGDFQSGECTQA